MAWRTNKVWILRKRKQLEKLKSKKDKKYLSTKNMSEKEKLEKWLIFEKENPMWKQYSRDKSGRKIICVQTGLREDLDAYRLLFKANSNEIYFVKTWINARLNKKIKKKLKNK